MRLYGLYSACALLALSSGALAEDAALLPSPPPLSDYLAYPTPPPPAGQRLQSNLRYLRGFYISGKLGYASISGNGMRNVTSGAVPPLPTPATSSFSARKTFPAVALGYQIRAHGGFLSRAEIEYSQITNIKYAGQLFEVGDFTITPNEINSNINTQTLLVKIYNDLDLGYPVIPYFQLGAGVGFNQTSGTAALFGFGSGSVSGSQTGFAWDAGVGVKFKATENLFFDVGYEFLGLPNTRFNLNLTDEFGDVSTASLKTSSVYANAVLASITWMPFPNNA